MGKIAGSNPAGTTEVLMVSVVKQEGRRRCERRGGGFDSPRTPITGVCSWESRRSPKPPDTVRICALLLLRSGHQPLIRGHYSVLGVWWIARDPAKVEDQVRLLTRMLDAGARRPGNRLQPGPSGFDSHRRLFKPAGYLFTLPGTGAVGSSVVPPCQSGAMLWLFQLFQAALNSATRCGCAFAKLFRSPMSFARS